MQLEGGGNTRRTGSRRRLGIERRQLMRIFTRAHIGDSRERQRVLGGKDLVVRAQVAGDVGVVDGAVLEGSGGQAPTRVRTYSVATPKLFEDTDVVVRIAHGQDVEEVLGRRAQQRVSADVDVFQSHRQPRAGLLCNFQKRVEIGSYEINRLQAVLGQLFEVARIVAQRQDPGVYRRVKRFDSPAEHFGKASELLNAANRNARRRAASPRCRRSKTARSQVLQAHEQSQQRQSCRRPTGSRAFRILKRMLSREPGGLRS